MPVLSVLLGPSLDSQPLPWPDSVAPAAGAGGAAVPRGLSDPGASAAYWRGLCGRADQLLRALDSPGFDGATFRHALQALHAELRARLEADADQALFALVHLVSAGNLHHSATHALLCAAAASLASAAVVGGSPAERHSAGCAALTMNVAMTALQDELAAQAGPPSLAQRAALARHAPGSALLLRQAGVTDPHWLEAVAHHHDAVCGPLGHRSPSQRIARLLQRADLFAAMISPRRSRRAVSGAAAAQAVSTGEDGQPDEAGLLLVKVLGLFPPGCPVRRVRGEYGVVLRRGARVHAPLVAAIADSQGRPLPAEQVRASIGAEHNGVQAALAPHELPLPLPFGLLLELAPRA